MLQKYRKSEQKKRRARKKSMFIIPMSRKERRRCSEKKTELKKTKKHEFSLSKIYNKNNKIGIAGAKFGYNSRTLTNFRQLPSSSFLFSQQEPQIFENLVKRPHMYLLLHAHTVGGPCYLKIGERSDKKCLGRSKWRAELKSFFRTSPLLW